MKKYILLLSFIVALFFQSAAKEIGHNFLLKEMNQSLIKNVSSTAVSIPSILYNAAPGMVSKSTDTATLTLVEVIVFIITAQQLIWLY